MLVRLARLSPAAQAVARAVVVLGDDADGRLAAELAGLDEAAAARGADELRAAAILDPDATLRFIHPLVRTALDAELQAGERAAAHARAVELLRARGASAQQLAAHLVATEARGERATAETLLEAGRTALASGAPRSASAYLTRALREPAPDDLRAAILAPLVTAGIRAPDRELFAAVLPAVLEELERDPGLHVRWGVKVSVWMIFSTAGPPRRGRCCSVRSRSPPSGATSRAPFAWRRSSRPPAPAARAPAARPYRDRSSPSPRPPAADGGP